MPTLLIHEPQACYNIKKSVRTFSYRKAETELLPSIQVNNLKPITKCCPNGRDKLVHETQQLALPSTCHHFTLTNANTLKSSSIRLKALVDLKNSTNSENKRKKKIPLQSAISWTTKQNMQNFSIQEKMASIQTIPSKN